MKKSSIIFFATALGFCFSSCENTENKDVKTAQVNTSQQQALSEKEKEFLMDAAKSNMMEVELGQLASQKASSADVKEFGSHMKMQHQKANDKLMKIAQKNNVTVPTSLPSDAQSKKENLMELSGKEFDKKYMKEMVDMHKKDMKKFEEMSKEAKNPEVKSFAQQTLPTLQMHYTEANNLDSMMTASEKKKKKATSMK